MTIAMRDTARHPKKTLANIDLTANSDNVHRIAARKRQDLPRHPAGNRGEYDPLDIRQRETPVVLREAVVPDQQNVVRRQPQLRKPVNPRRRPVSRR